jgi:hypothetical protein
MREVFPLTPQMEQLLLRFLEAAQVTPENPPRVFYLDRLVDTGSRLT